MRSLLVTLFVLITSVCTHAQVQYQRYGTKGFDAFQAMATAPDGQTWVAGTRDKQGWVVLLDENGQILKEILIRPVAPESEIDILGIDVGENGNLILTGAAKVGATTPVWYGWLAVMDSKGKIFHRKVLEEDVYALKAVQKGNFLYVAGFLNESFKSRRIVYKVNLNLPQPIWKASMNENSMTSINIGAIDVSGDGCTVSWAMERNSTPGFFQETFDKDGKVNLDFEFWETGNSSSIGGGFNYSNYETSPIAIFRDSDKTTWVAYSSWMNKTVILVSFDSKGKLQFRGEYPYNGALSVVSHLRVLKDGQKIIVGANRIFIDTEIVEHPVLLKIDKNGLLQSQRYFDTEKESCRVYAGYQSTGNGYLLLGVIVGDFNTYYSDGMVLFAENSGTSSYKGKLFVDKDNDCNQSTTEKGLQGWMVRLKYPNGKILDESVTNAEGEFTFKQWPGNYVLEVVNKDPSVYRLCETSKPINIGVQGVLVPVSIGVKEQFIPCSDVPVIGVTEPVLVPCSSAYFFIQVENKHSEPTMANQLEVQLDEAYLFLSATMDVSRIGKKLVFDVPSLLPGAIFRIGVQVEVPCAIPYGKALPVHARMVQTPCVDQWQGSLWSLEGKCENGKVVFTLKDKQGNGVTQGLKYEVLRNYFTLDRQSDIVLQNQELQWSKPADGKTYEFRLLGLPENPWGDSVITATVKGCTAHANQLLEDQFCYSQPMPYSQQGVFSIYPVTVLKDRHALLAASPGYGQVNYFSKVQRLDHTLNLPNEMLPKNSSVMVDLQVEGELDPGTFKVIASSANATWQYMGLKTFRIFFDTKVLAQNNQPLQFRFSMHPTRSIKDTFGMYSQTVSLKATYVSDGMSPRFLHRTIATFSPENWMYDPFDSSAISIGGNGSDWPAWALNLPNGDMYLLSTSNTYDLNDEVSLQLHYLDSTASKVRTTIIPTEENSPYQLIGMMSDNSGGVLLVINKTYGNFNLTGQYQLVLVKVNQAGKLVSETVVTPPAGYDFINAISVTEGPNGEQLLLANHRKRSGSGFVDDQFLWEIKEDGSLVDWNAQSLDVRQVVGLTYRKEFVLAYKAVPVTSWSKNYFLLLYNKNNENLWTIPVNTMPRTLIGYSLDEDGTVHLLWREWNKGDPSLGTYIYYIEQVNLNGAIDKVIQLSALGQLPAGIHQFTSVPNQGYMFSGNYYPPGENQSQLFIAATDIEGNVKHLESFGGDAHEDLFQASLVQNNKVVVVGTVSGGNTDQQMVLYKSSIPAILTSTKSISSLAPTITVHPNPASEWLSIHLPEQANEPLRWELLGTDGKQVLEGWLQNSNQRVSLQGLPEGVYLLRFPETSWAAARVVVQR